MDAYPDATALERSVYLQTYAFKEGMIREEILVFHRRLFLHKVLIVILSLPMIVLVPALVAGILEPILIDIFGEDVKRSCNISLPHCFQAD
ncbi:MAG: hypothetical protein AAGE89_05055 [Pseudomonadota bacterium]